jgi:hypothetical protein
MSSYPNLDEAERRYLQGNLRQIMRDLTVRLQRDRQKLGLLRTVSKPTRADRLDMRRLAASIHTAERMQLTITRRLLDAD